MGRPFRAWLSGAHVYGCAACQTHVADADDIVSKVGEEGTGGRGGAPRRVGARGRIRPAPPPVRPRVPHEWVRGTPDTTWSARAAAGDRAEAQRPPSGRVAVPPISGFPRPARPRLPLQHGRQRGRWPPGGAPFDYGPSHCRRPALRDVRGGARVDVRGGVRRVATLQRGEIDSGEKGGGRVSVAVGPRARTDTSPTPPFSRPRP
jgi:hypothetical protein